MDKLQKVEFRYVINWTNLKRMGIDLELIRSGIVSDKVSETWKSILKEKMPEMLRVEGYDPCGTPRLTADYFFKYILAAFFSQACKYEKPQGRYLYTKDRYRVLVDWDNKPISPSTPELYVFDKHGKKYVRKVCGL